MDAFSFQRVLGRVPIRVDFAMSHLRDAAMAGPSLLSSANE